MFDLELAPRFSDQELEQLTVSEFAAWDGVEPDRHLVPADLDSWEPGPWLAAVLSSIDPARVNGHDIVTLMRAHSRQVAHDQAGYYRSIGEVATAVPTGDDGPPERSQEWYEYANMEVRAALTLTRRAADNEIGNAHDLLERLPSVWQALHSGAIDIRKALTFARGTGHLDESDARDVANRALTDAPDQTTGQLRARLRRLCIETNPEDAKKRTKTAVEERRMIIEPTVDCTADLHACGAPIDRAAAIGRRINGFARSLKNSGETRTMDQLRMDVFLDLLEGNKMGTVERSRGGVVIHVGLETLAGLSESSGDLGGYGPVQADIARQVAAGQPDAEWRFVVTDDAGNVAHTGITRRRPTAAQKREVLARYHTCVFPGCAAPAEDCDIDHIDPFAEGGETSVRNNAPVCEPDHYGRHQAGWTYRRLPDGRHEWTSRLGHTYITWEDHPP